MSISQSSKRQAGSMLELERTLPERVPGIVVAEGCLRVRNDEAAYLDVLGMFQRRYANVAHTFSNPAAHESGELFELAHSLISTAGLLGANTLSALAGELQQRLTVRDHQAAVSLSARVASELALVLSSASQLLENARAPASRGDSPSGTA